MDSLFPWYRQTYRSLFVLPLLAALACEAQTGTGERESGSWEEVLAALTPVTPLWSATPPTTAEAAAFRRQQADRFLAAAEKAKSFASANPGHVRSTEAKAIEAKALLQAAMAGDAKQVERANGLVQSLRRDDALPARARLELVALADIVRLRARGADRETFTAAHEQALRDLVAEFPDEPAGYERLLRFAENHYDDATAIRIAQNVAAMKAPAGVVDSARAILAQHALAGQSLAELAGAALGTANPLSETRDRAVLLYTWSAAVPGTLALGRDLALTLPAGAHLVGFNCDADATAAQALAAAEKLPGEQLYDPRGFAGPLAQALQLRRLGEVYVTDRQGIIRSVSARRGDLTAKMAWATR